MKDYLSKFKNTSLEERLKASNKMRDKYPERCCLIVSKMSSSNVPDIDKHKYLVPQSLTVGQFVYVIRKRISLDPEKALYIYINYILPSTSLTIGQLYNEHKDEDNMLYITYAGESTFG